jgi:PBSX family phage terminase large subunit
MNEVDLSPTKKQVEIFDYYINFDPLFCILEGAVRSGKTQIGIRLWYLHVLNFFGMGLKFIMTGTTIASLQRNVLDDLGLMYDVDVTLNKRNEFQLLGNTMCCFGSDKIDSYKPIKGFTAHGWYGNEVTEHHKNTVDQCVKRCSGPGWRIIWDTNPDGPTHYIKTDYIDRSGEVLSDGTLHIKSFHFILDDNEKLTSLYRESLKKNTPTGVWYDRDILGLWVAAEGMIYRDFNIDLHGIDVLPDLKTYFCGVDWGYEHNGVIALYGIDHDGNSYRVREWVARHETIDYWKHVALDLKNTYKNPPFYADPSRPDYIAEFRKLGIDTREAANEVVEGITHVAERFKKKTHYIYKPGNREYLKKIYNYRWRDNAAKEEPIKEDDDEMDSERYALYSHIGKSREIKATQTLGR